MKNVWLETIDMLRLAIFEKQDFSPSLVHQTFRSENSIKQSALIENI